MFSLIITLVSIALVAALALATLYYGGSSWLRGNAAASAATLANQGQQVLAAMTLYYTDHSAYPTALEDLVTGEYLKTVPVPPSTAALEPGLVAPALAAGELWTLVAAGQPAAMVREAVSREVCQEVNYRLLGSDAVREKARTDVSAQCFGPAAGPFTFVVGVPADAAAPASLARAFEHYNAAHAGAPLAVVTAAAPDNPVTVPETRNASPVASPGGPTGVTLALGAFAPQASVASGDGGALMRATGSLSINGAVPVPLTLERSVSAANLATVARAASWSVGPAALPGLSFTNLSWDGIQWVKPDPNGPVLVAGPMNEYNACSRIGVVGGYGSGTREYTGQPGVFRIVPFGTSTEGWVGVNNCTNLPPSDQVHFPMLLFQANGTLPAPAFVAASGLELESATASALLAQPSVAGEVLDAALAVVQGAAELRHGPLAVSGPAMAGSGDAAFELTYLGDTVTVSDGEASASATVLWP